MLILVASDHQKDTYTSADGMLVVMESWERKTRRGMYVIREGETGQRVEVDVGLILTCRTELIQRSACEHEAVV